jgi:hypothetical protein
MGRRADCNFTGDRVRQAAGFRLHSRRLGNRSLTARSDNGGMRTIWVLSIALFVAACSQESEVTGSTNACAAGLYSPYNPKVMKQCVDVCIKCNRGVTTTCTTACTLKGAV